MRQALRQVKKAHPEYIALYNLLLDSGLRLIEAVKVMREPELAEQINGFYRIALGLFRGSKQAYYAYATEVTYKQIIAVKAKPLDDRFASGYYSRFNIIRPKYIRKFVFDTM